MIYELRIYHIYPNRMEAIQDRFKNHTIRLFEKHGLKMLDFWEDVVDGDKIFYILEHNDIESRNANFKSFKSDPKWEEVKIASELNGPIVEKIEGYFMKRLPFSPSRI